MTPARRGPALLALGCAVLLTAAAPPPRPQRAWEAWLRRDAGVSGPAATCIADQAADALPDDLLRSTPREGFASVPDAWRPQVAQIFMSCVIEAG